MSEAKHTPGPWVIDPCWDILGNGKGTGVVCEVSHPNCDNDAFWTDGEAQANAHLIAAAPELLDALECCVDQLKRMGMDDAPGYLDAVYVIAKAKGTSK